MGDSTWSGCESRVHRLASHLGEALAELLEFPTVLEHVADLLLTILFVDVEVDGAGTRQLVVRRRLIVAVATLPRLRGSSAITVVATVVSAVVVAIITMIGVSNRNHVNSIAVIIDARSSLVAALAPAAKVVFFMRMCSVDGILAICPAVGDVHEVIKGFGLDTPELLLENWAPGTVLEGVDCPFFRDVCSGFLDVGLA